MNTPDQEPLPRLVRALLHALDEAARAHFGLAEAEQSAASAQAALSVLRQSVSFRVGAALVDATKSWHGLVALPRRAFAILRDRDRSTMEKVVVERERASFTPPPWPGADLLALLREQVPPPVALRELRVAGVLDQFTHDVFAPDCRLVNLPAEGFERILDEFAPHLLLVESAWRGLNDGWRDKVSPTSANLHYLLDCCRRRGIPTVFWNKEDPSHFDYFLETAALFDHVFTTDADCIPRYVEALGHSRVELLAFACQPTLHHPVESRRREQAACFAGSWYRAYPERSRAFDAIVDAVQRVMPVAIYDRNQGRDDPDFAFPERYRPLIKGHLPYARINEAYKAYEYAITVNSVRNSPTMLARRVYELLACNTLVVSNPTRSVVQVFDDIVIGARTDDDVEAGLRRLIDQPIERDRRRLKGLRAVLSQHTAAHRLREICATVLGVQLATPADHILVVARVRSRAQAHAMTETYLRQTWVHKRLCLLVADEAVGFDVGHVAGIAVVEDPGEALVAFAPTETPQWLAVLHPDDHYGPRYLQDLALASSYAPQEPRIGKGQRFQLSDQASLTMFAVAAYRNSAPLMRRAMIERWREIENGNVSQRINEMEAETEPSLSGLVIDGFEYCRGGAGRALEHVDV